VALNLRLELRIPEDYVPDAHQRMSLYKRLSQSRSLAEVRSLEQEIRERYGAPPRLVSDLVAYAGARARSEALGVEQVDRVRDALAVRLRDSTPLGPAQLIAAVSAWPGASLLPEGGVRVPVGESRAIQTLERLLDMLEACRAPGGPGV
jgi:transcription-repair coupling factor (superfamily II helicase)